MLDFDDDDQFYYNKNKNLSPEYIVNQSLSQQN